MVHRILPLLPYGLIALYFLQGPLAFGGLDFTDYFHEGENFAGLSSFLYQESFYPLIIHGLLDVIPGFLALHWLGHESFAVATRFIYIALHLWTCLIGLQILKRYWNDHIGICLVASIIPSLVGYRDLSILLLLLQFLRAVAGQQFHSKWHSANLVLLGMLGAFNLLFSSNRGIAGTLAIGAGVLIMATTDRRWLIAVASMGFALLFLHATHPIFSFDGYLQNTWHFITTTSQWSYKSTWETWFFKGLMTVLLIGSAGLGLFATVKGRLGVENLATATCLFILSVFFIQISTYRADAGHAAMGLFPALVNLAFVWKLLEKYPAGNRTLRRCQSLLKSVSAVSMLAVKVKTSFGLFSVYWVLNTFGRIRLARWWATGALGLLMAAGATQLGTSVRNGSSYLWVDQLVTNISKESALSATNQWLVSQINLRKPGCIFDMTNNGVLYAATQVPPCTRFSYLIYGGSKNEKEMILALEEHRPSMVISKADYTGYAIDNIPMSHRFTKLDDVIKKSYPNEICDGEACIRIR